MTVVASTDSTASDNGPSTISSPESITSVTFSNSSTSNGQRVQRTRSQYSPQRLAASMVRTVRQAIPVSFHKDRSLRTRSESMPPDIIPHPAENTQRQLRQVPETKKPARLGRSTSCRTTAPSPLASAPSNILSDSSSPEEVSSKGQRSAFASPVLGGGARIIFDLFGRRERTPSSSFSSSRVASPEPPDPRMNEAAERVVARYMDLADRQSSGHLDISDETKRGNGLLGSLRKPMPCTMYYEVFGTGPKKLFLIMGMLGTTMYWRLQSRYFANHGDYTVCVFDNRGSGKSTIAPGPYKISQMARDATRLLDHLGWTHGIHMVGISLGGMVAQELCLLNNEQDPTASEFPRFESVVLVDTWHSAALALPTVEELRFSFNGMAAFGDDPKHLIKLVFSPEWIRAPFHDAAAKQGDPPSPEMDAPVLTNKDVMGRLFRAVQDDLGIHRGRTGDTKAAERTGSPLVNAGGIAAEKQPRLHHSRSATSPSHPTQPPPSMAQSKTTHTTPSSSKREASGDIHQFIACLGHRLSSTRVRSIRTYNPRTRFLVIHGERDRVIRPFCGRALAKLLECPVVWIAGAGHMPPIDAHCSFNLVVRAFTLNERWLRDLPDRTCLVPPTWDEQVKAHQWISRESKSTDLELDLGDPSSPEPVVHLAWVDGPPKPRGRRVSRVDCIQPVGPLPKELLLIDETDPECAARVIPANVPAPMIGGSRDPTTTSSLQSIAEWLSPAPTIPASVPSSAASSPPPQTRELLACGVLVDAPFRIRRYSRPHHHHHPTPNDI